MYKTFALKAQSFHEVGEVWVPIYPTRGATTPRPCIDECMSFKQFFLHFNKTNKQQLLEQRSVPHVNGKHLQSDALIQIKLALKPTFVKLFSFKLFVFLGIRA